MVADNTEKWATERKNRKMGHERRRDAQQDDWNKHTAQRARARNNAQDSLYRDARYDSTLRGPSTHARVIGGGIKGGTTVVNLNLILEIYAGIK